MTVTETSSTHPSALCWSRPSRGPFSALRRFDWRSLFRRCKAMVVDFGSSHGRRAYHIQICWRSQSLSERAQAWDAYQISDTLLQILSPYGLPFSAGSFKGLELYRSTQLREWNFAIRSLYMPRSKLGVSNEDSICRVGVAARVLYDFWIHFHP